MDIIIEFICAVGRFYVMTLMHPLDNFIFLPALAIEAGLILDFFLHKEV